MTHDEYLLIVAAEECAEIQNEIAKTLRFGIDNHHPDEPDRTNGVRILTEYNQLRAIMDLLVMQNVLPGMSLEDSSLVYREKIDAVDRWEEYSRSIGKVN